eukprot:XP_001949184.2 PREDICTED: uncharacterized protein LOC100160795 [Acyrthosiphon pisum]
MSNFNGAQYDVDGTMIGCIKDSAPLPHRLFCVPPWYHAYHSLRTAGKTYRSMAFVDYVRLKRFFVQNSTVIDQPVDPHYSNELNSDQQRSTKTYKKLPAPMVDDDLLEFLVRVADNPAEWNKIRRVLSMLGRDETGTPTAATVAADDGNHVGAAAVSIASTSTPVPPVTTPSTAPPRITATVAGVDNERGAKHQPPPPPPPPPTTSSSSWPSGDWIMKTVQDIKAAARARGIGAGGEDYDGDDDGNDYDYDDQTDDEIEEIEAPTATAPPQPSRPPLVRTVPGHMSRYEFKRLDGRPDDGRVNGTYVAVIESDRPPRVVIYDPARQKKPRTGK